MTIEYTFQKAQLNEDERLWLSEVHQSQEFDVKKTKVKLYGKIPNNFDVRKINQRLYQYNHLTLVGIWLIEPESKIFEKVALVITQIKKLILSSPGIDKVSAIDLAKVIGLQEEDVEEALRLMCDLGNFNGGASYSSNGRGFSSITFPTGDDGYDVYLSYDNLNDLMEQYYAWKPPISVGATGINWISPNIVPGAIPNDEVTQKNTTAYINNTAFIMMPINPNRPELEDIYVAIKEACEMFDIKAVRADSIEHQERITDVVLKQIRNCEFLIADLSDDRPNVYYEVGYAHACGRRPILYRKQGTNLHFDLAAFGCPEYQNATTLKALLKKRFEAILGK